VHVSGFAGSDGIRSARFRVSHFAGEGRSRDDRWENPWFGGGFSETARPQAGRDQGLDPASRRSAAARKRGSCAGIEKVRHAAVLGYSRKRGKFVERDDTFHFAGVAGEEAAEGRRICAGGGVRAGI